MNIRTIALGVTALTAALICDVSAQTSRNVKPPNSDRLDSMQEMSQERQQRMQMYMDRHSKAQETTSNFMKKNLDTKRMIQNMK